MFCSSWKPNDVRNEWRPSDFQSTCYDRKADKMSLPLSVIKHKFSCSVTCSLNSWKNQIKASFVSPSTIANVKGNTFWLPSWVIVVSKVSSYQLFKNVSSTWTMAYNIWNLRCMVWKTKKHVPKYSRMCQCHHQHSQEN